MPFSFSGNCVIVGAVDEAGVERTDVVIGAAAGMGAAVAHRLAADGHHVGLAAQSEIQFRENHDVELQALGLVNCHYPQASRGRVFNAAALDYFDEVARSGRGFLLVGIGQIDELIEAAQVAAVAKFA